MTGVIGSINKMPENRIYPCYGKEHGKHEECKGCELEKYCEESCQIVTGKKTYLAFEKIEYAEEYADDAGFVLDIDGVPDVNNPVTIHCIQYFQDFLAKILRLTDKQREIVMERFVEPRITFEEIAARYEVSRQAVHKTFTKVLKKHPEFASALKLSCQAKGRIVIGFAHEAENKIKITDIKQQWKQSRQQKVK